MARKEWDDDIAAMNLSDVERNGLQVYRNYSSSFAAAREKQFAAGVDAAPLDMTALREVLSHTVAEDIRFVPIIACAFADEELQRMYKMFLPEDIPGGKKAMLGRFGPISTLFNRIQFAFAFDMVHSDILIALDRLREHRNNVAHTWNLRLLDDFFKEPLPMMDELEEAFTEFPEKIRAGAKYGPETSLRLRSVWLLTRLFYETRFYPLAKMAQVSPFRALYGPNHPNVLGRITAHAIESTNLLLPRNTQ
jgi:hypothetical protein